jgi:hypothetical protein
MINRTRVCAVSVTYRISNPPQPPLSRGELTVLPFGKRPSDTSTNAPREEAQRIPFRRLAKTPFDKGGWGDSVLSKPKRNLIPTRKITSFARSAKARLAKGGRGDSVLCEPKRNLMPTCKITSFAHLAKAPLDKGGWGDSVRH